MTIKFGGFSSPVMWADATTDVGNVTQDQGSQITKIYPSVVRSICKHFQAVSP